MPLLLLDFDGTITHSDTINALARSVISQYQTTTPAAWDAIVHAWLDDHARHSATHKPACPGDVLATLAFLETFRPLEMASLARVEAAGLFRGVTPADLSAMGTTARSTAGGGGKSEVSLRKGFTELISEVHARGWDLAVVSVNWSRDWVAGVLGNGVVDKVRWMIVNRAGVDNGRVRGPEGFDRPLVTAGDKRDAARTVVREWRAKGAKGGWVYAGDSMTDLGCLLDASMGVVMADGDGEGEDRGEGKLLGALKRFGHEVKHVGDCAKHQKMTWARDFEEILKSEVLNLVEDADEEGA